MLWLLEIWYPILCRECSLSRCVVDNEPHSANLGRTREPYLVLVMDPHPPFPRAEWPEPPPLCCQCPPVSSAPSCFGNSQRSSLKLHRVPVFSFQCIILKGSSVGHEFSQPASFLPFLSEQPEGVYFGLFRATFPIC